jgi:hypothetical protein
MTLASTWLFHVVLSMSWGPLDTGVHTLSSWFQVLPPTWMERKGKISASHSLFSTCLLLLLSCFALLPLL